MIGAETIEREGETSAMAEGGDTLSVEAAAMGGAAIMLGPDLVAEIEEIGAAFSLATNEDGDEGSPDRSKEGPFNS